MKALKILAAAALMASTLASADGGKVLSSDGGRYVFGQVSEARRDQFMLDTTTGRLWRVVCDKAPNAANTSTEDCRPILEAVYYWDGVFEKVAPYQGTDKSAPKPKLKQ